MRASRLLRLLLLLQNRGRMTSGQLAIELEVAQRTILRDVDALTEAGLPIIVHQGNQGGIELGFNYRTRLTGLAADEAEAMAVILTHPIPELEALGMAQAGHRARAKMLESFPDGVREGVELACRRFTFAPAGPAPVDPRIGAVVLAIRERRIVRLRARTPVPQVVHPVRLEAGPAGWAIVDAREPQTLIPQADWSDVNVSALTFQT